VAAALDTHTHTHSQKPVAAVGGAHPASNGTEISGWRRSLH
jgi:hypothetical protein